MKDLLSCFSTAPPSTLANKSLFKLDKERDIALISLMICNGVRVSEAVSLTMEDINLPKDKISIIRKGNKRDTINVLEYALEDLKTYLRIRARYPGIRI